MDAKKLFLLGVSVLVGLSSAVCAGQWSTEKAWQWYRNVGVIKGCNYLPRTATNTTEMWQDDTFDPATIDEELGWAENLGYNSVRIFMQYLVWEKDRKGFFNRLDTFLDIANKHGITAMIVLFDDCAFGYPAKTDPYLGKQGDPAPGEYAPYWTPSPGHSYVRDKSRWPLLEKYVKDVVGRFKNDNRVLIWDLYNEPGNAGIGQKSLPLVKKTFDWARSVNPSQPLTTCWWVHELSDVITFHSYSNAESTRREILKLRDYGRPIINTEWLLRRGGNTVAEILPVFEDLCVGWYHWGLVVGRTQTCMHWSSKKGDPIPENWQHDIFHSDGTPYRAEENEQLKAFTFPKWKVDSIAKQWNGKVLKNDLVELTVVPQIGGRVIQYKLGDYGFFWVNPDLVNSTPPASGLGPEDSWLNYGGAKLWPAPQGWDNDRQWPGPPDAVLDGQPYSYEVLTDGKEVQSVRLTSREDRRSGIRFSRIITIKKGTTRVTVDATMKNIDSKPRRWGIWDHIQFNAANRHGQGYNENFWGYCLLNEQSKFYKGYSVQYGLVNNPTFKPDYENGVMRVHYQHLVGKAGVDSPGGWVATVDATDGYVFVHRYTYEPQKPYPEDSSVEFWFNGMGQFGAWGKLNTMGDKPEDIPYVMESEIISPFAELQPGEEYTFRYAWCSAKIPPGMGVVSCNDMGVLCEPLKANLKDGKLLLSGSGGIFYEGTLSVTAIDKQGRGTVVLDGIPVTPLEPVDFKAVAAKPVQKKVPAKTARIVIEIADKEGNHIGRFAEANISQ